MAIIKVTLEPRGSGRTAVVLDDEELVVGHGAVVCHAARKLIERGHNLTDRLEAYRDDTLCLGGLLGTFARLTVKENTRDGVPRFVRWAPPPDTLRNVQGAPPISLSEPALSEAGSEPEPLYGRDSEVVQ
jgi:hypothetical protein